jgi:hypothetical protein
MPAPQQGLYRLKQGELSTVVAVGPPSPREFEETLASAEVLEPVVEAAGGGVLRIEDGLPDLRTVGEGRTAAGRGWIGITPRGAHVTQDIRISALLPEWVWLAIASALILLAWLREGRLGGKAV